MTRVKVFGLLGVLAAIVAAGPDLAAQDKTGSPGGGSDPKVRAFAECAKACDDCARSCDTCANHCANLIGGGQKHHLATLKTCQDCAAVCRAASAIVAKQGPFSDVICTACAETCKRCGDACEQHGGNDPTMKACADECRRCEKACREMLRHVGHGQGGAAPPAK